MQALALARHEHFRAASASFYSVSFKLQNFYNLVSLHGKYNDPDDQSTIPVAISKMTDVSI